MARDLATFSSISARVILYFDCPSSFVVETRSGNELFVIRSETTKRSGGMFVVLVVNLIGMFEENLSGR